MTDKGRRILAEGPVHLTRAARLLGVSRSTIRAAVLRGALPGLCGGCGRQFSKLQLSGHESPEHQCLFKGSQWGKKRYRVVIPRHLVQRYTVNRKRQRAGRRARNSLDKSKLTTA